MKKILVLFAILLLFVGVSNAQIPVTFKSDTIKVVVIYAKDSSYVKFFNNVEFDSLVSFVSSAVFKGGAYIDTSIADSSLVTMGYLTKVGIGQADNADSLGHAPADSFVKVAVLSDSVSMLFDSIYARGDTIWMRAEISDSLSNLDNHYFGRILFSKGDTSSISVRSIVYDTLVGAWYGRKDDSTLVRLDNISVTSVDNSDSLGGVAASSYALKSDVSDSIQTKDEITEISGAIDSLATKATFSDISDSISVWMDSAKAWMSDTLNSIDSTKIVDGSIGISDVNGLQDKLDTAISRVSVSQLYDSVSTFVKLGSVGDSITAHLKDSLYARLIIDLGDSLLYHDGLFDEITEISGATDSLATKATFSDISDSINAIDSTKIANNALSISDVNDLENRLQAAGSGSVTASQLSDSIQTLPDSSEVRSMISDSLSLHYKSSTVDSIVSDSATYYFNPLSSFNDDSLVVSMLFEDTANYVLNAFQPDSFHNVSIVDTGKIDNAALFDSSLHSYISFNSCSTEFSGYTKGRIEFWFKNWEGGAHYIFNVSNANGTGEEAYVIVGDNFRAGYDNESIEFSMITGSTVKTRFLVDDSTTRNKVKDGNWHWVSIIVGDTCSIFFDGVKQNVSVSVWNSGYFLNISNADWVSLGARKYDGSFSGYFNGMLDEFRLYKNVSYSDVDSRYSYLNQLYLHNRDMKTDKFAVNDSLSNRYTKSEILSIVSDSIQTRDEVSEIIGLQDSLNARSTTSYTKTLISDSIKTLPDSSEVRSIVYDSVWNLLDTSAVVSLISDSIQTKDEITEISGAIDSLATKATFSDVSDSLESHEFYKITFGDGDTSNVPIKTIVYDSSLDAIYFRRADSILMRVDNTVTGSVGNADSLGGIAASSYALKSDVSDSIQTRDEVSEIIGLQDSLDARFDTTATRSEISDSLLAFRSTISDSIQTRDEVSEIIGLQDSLNIRPDTIWVLSRISDSIQTKDEVSEIVGLQDSLNARADTLFMFSAIMDSVVKHDTLYDEVSEIIGLQDSLNAKPNIVDIRREISDSIQATPSDTALIKSIVYDTAQVLRNNIVDTLAVMDSTYITDGNLSIDDIHGLRDELDEGLVTASQVSDSIDVATLDRVILNGDSTNRLPYFGGGVVSFSVSGGNASYYLREAGTNQWTIRNKGSGDYFQILDSGDNVRLTIDQNGNLYKGDGTEPDSALATLAVGGGVTASPILMPYEKFWIDTTLSQNQTDTISAEIFSDYSLAFYSDGDTSGSVQRANFFVYYQILSKCSSADSFVIEYATDSNDSTKNNFKVWVGEYDPATKTRSYTDSTDYLYSSVAGTYYNTKLTGLSGITAGDVFILRIEVVSDRTDNYNTWAYAVKFRRLLLYVH